MYLEDKIDELFETYIKSFNKQSTTLLETLGKNGKKIICLTKFYYLMVHFMKFDF